MKAFQYRARGKKRKKWGRLGRAWPLNATVNNVTAYIRIEQSILIQKCIIYIYQPLRSGRIWHKVNF